MKTHVQPTPAPTVTPPSGRFRLFLTHWLPVALWLLVIFGFSTDVGSSQHTSRFIGPFLRWLDPGVSDDTIQMIQLAVRKSAHLTEYAILAGLLWRAFRRAGGPTAGRPWDRGTALAAILAAGLFAASDEWHQSTVPSRQGQFSDVLLDTSGATLGVMAIWAAGRKRKRW